MLRCWCQGGGVSAARTTDGIRNKYEEQGCFGEAYQFPGLEFWGKRSWDFQGWRLQVAAFRFCSFAIMFRLLVLGHDSRLEIRV